MKRVKNIKIKAVELIFYPKYDNIYDKFINFHNI